VTEKIFMQFAYSSPPRSKRLHPVLGLTLVELLIALSVSSLLMAGVLAVVLALARTAIKNERVERTATSARQIQ
jgi:prepilin-type N-terminal cleavage/methylation domain-containing protein